MRHRLQLLVPIGSDSLLILDEIRESDEAMSTRLVHGNLTLFQQAHESRSRNPEVVGRLLGSQASAQRSDGHPFSRSQGSGNLLYGLEHRWRQLQGFAACSNQRWALGAVPDTGLVEYADEIGYDGSFIVARNVGAGSLCGRISCHRRSESRFVCDSMAR